MIDTPLLISPENLKKIISNIDQNVSDDLLIECIVSIQETKLFEVIGPTLYNTLINGAAAIDSGVTSSMPVIMVNSVETDTKVLWRDYITKYLAYEVAIAWFYSNTVKWTNKGSLVYSDQNSRPATSNENETALSVYRSRLSLYKKKLEDYLITQKLKVSNTDDNIANSDGLGWYMSRHNMFNHPDYDFYNGYYANRRLHPYLFSDEIFETPYSSTQSYST